MPDLILTKINILFDNIIFVGGIMTFLLIYTSYIYYKILEENMSDKGKRRYARYIFYTILLGLYFVVIGYSDDAIIENKFGIDKHPVFIFGFLAILLIPIVLIISKRIMIKTKHRNNPENKGI